MKHILYILFLCCAISNIQAQRGYVSDYSDMQSEITRKYRTFLNKSQFESKSDYELRIKDESNASYNKIVDEVIDESKNKALEPFFLNFSKSKWNKNSDLEYDAESETFFLLKGIQIPISKKVAEEFYNRMIDKNHKVLVVPQEVSIIEDNWHYTSVLVLFDLYERAEITPQLKFYSLDGPLDRIDVKRIDTKNKNCYIQNIQFGSVKLPIYDLKQLQCPSSNSIQEHIYFYEWEDNNIDPLDIQSFDALYDKAAIISNNDISRRYTVKDDTETKKSIDNQMSGLFGNATGSGSRGNTESIGTQGVPAGNTSYGKTLGVSSPASFDLGGRSLGPGGMVIPRYSVEEYGVVVVDIVVNAKGDVVEAAIGRGTNTTNTNLRDEAVKAAKKTRFNAVSPAAANQKGKITYKFNLN